jgi:hypothetical protein
MDRWGRVGRGQSPPQFVRERFTFLWTGEGTGREGTVPSSVVPSSVRARAFHFFEQPRIMAQHARRRRGRAARGDSPPLALCVPS